MSHKSSDIDAAIVAKLGADTTLLALCPNGVYIDEAPQDLTRFVIVSLVDELDTPVFGARAFEEGLYSIEARLRNDFGTGANANAQTAAARIDVLLDNQPLTIGSPPASVTGFTYMAMNREERIRATEIDDLDPSIRWYRAGGYYRVFMDVNP